MSQRKASATGAAKPPRKKNPLEKNAAILSDGTARLHLYDYKQLPPNVRDCNCV